MMPADLDAHPQAKKEARIARLWYAKRSVRTAQRFVLELQRAVDLILEDPERWPIYLHETRCFALRKLPYIVVYSYADGVVYVLSVAHTSRRPGYWRRRLKS